MNIIIYLIAIILKYLFLSQQILLGFMNTCHTHTMGGTVSKLFPH